MATRILIADLATFVKDTLLNIRIGVEQARSQGLICELPLDVDFNVELVSNDQSVVQVTTTARNDTSHQTVDRSGEIENTTESYSGSEVTTEDSAGGETTTETVSGNEVTTESPSGDEITIEEAVTDTETVSREARQNTSEGGGDLEISNYSYQSFEE